MCCYTEGGERSNYSPVLEVINPMGIPNLKRIRVKSEQELESWLARHPSHKEDVMVVTHANTSHDKFVSHEGIGQVLATHNWKAGRRYTIGNDLLGHVITRPVP